VENWKPEHAELLVSTVKCGSCGKTWLSREEVDDGHQGDSAAIRDDEGVYVCSNCGARAVWELGVRTIPGQQG
jgi:hypothetical protein